MLRLPAKVPEFLIIPVRRPQTKHIARIRHVTIALCADFRLDAFREDAFSTFNADWSSLLARKMTTLGSNMFEEEVGDRLRWQRVFVGLETLQLNLRLRRCHCSNLNNVLKVLRYGELRLHAKKLEVMAEFLVGGYNSHTSCQCCEKICEIVKGYLVGQL